MLNIKYTILYSILHTVISILLITTVWNNTRAINEKNMAKKIAITNKDSIIIELNTQLKMHKNNLKYIQKEYEKLIEKELDISILVYNYKQVNKALDNRFYK